MSIFTGYNSKLAVLNRTISFRKSFSHAINTSRISHQNHSISQLSRSEVQMKDNWQVYRFNYGDRGRDLDFMGFRFFRRKTVLRRTIYFKAVRKAKRIKNRGLNIYTVRQMLSYMGWFKCTDCYGAYLKYIKPNVSFRTLRRYVSRWDKKHNKEIINYGYRFSIHAVGDKQIF